MPVQTGPVVVGQGCFRGSPQSSQAFSCQYAVPSGRINNFSIAAVWPFVRMLNNAGTHHVQVDIDTNTKFVY
jgi:hypothetical protein